MRVLLLLAVAANLLVSFVADAHYRGMCRRPPPKTCKQKSLPDISNDFMFKFLKAVLKNEKKCTSLILSTFNIEQVMYEVTNAACGQTLRELEKYFEICDIKQVNEEFKKDIYQIQINQTSYDGKTEALVQLFSGIFIQRGFAIKGSYLQLLKDDYKAIARVVDFVKQQEAVKNLLNSYINNATHGIFPKFFTDPLPTNTVILEIAVVYFFSQWPSQYFHLDSEKRNFYQYCDEKSFIQSAQYLNNHDGVRSAAYAEIYGFKIVSLPYVTSSYSILLMLPIAARQDVATLLAKLDSSKLKKIFDATKDKRGCRVNVTIPCFEINYRLILNSIFKKGGIESLFERADLCKGVKKDSPDANKLAVSTITTQAFIRLNEKGTTAAAITALGVSTTAIQVCDKSSLKHFFANRPFAFIIKNEKLGIALFIGICNKPDYKV